MDANKGFCFRFWERRSADIYLDSNGRCAAEIYGQSFDESGPITRTGNWTRLSDSVLSEWDVYATADSGALVDTYFKTFNVLYNERMLDALEAKYPGLEIGDPIYEDRVYHATINGKRVVVKLLATNMGSESAPNGFVSACIAYRRQMVTQSTSSVNLKKATLKPCLPAAAPAARPVVRSLPI